MVKGLQVTAKVKALRLWQGTDLCLKLLAVGTSGWSQVFVSLVGHMIVKVSPGALHHLSFMLKKTLVCEQVLKSVSVSSLHSTESFRV